MSRLIREKDVYALFALNGTAHLHVGDIDVLPRVDAKEVVHGRWTAIYNGNKWVFNCNLCNCYIEAETSRNYCPGCGAKMDAEE